MLYALCAMGYALHIGQDQVLFYNIFRFFLLTIMIRQPFPSIVFYKGYFFWL